MIAGGGFGRRALRAACIAGACAFAACSGDPGWSGNVPVADLTQFQTSVYPVLLRDCAFSECHGAPQRFFQVFGPGRTRLPADTKTDDPVTQAELQVSYLHAIAMLSTDGNADVTQSLLLRKPLEAQNGGVGHRGVDDFGRNVYASRDAPGWIALYTWAKGLPSPTISARAGAAPPTATGATAGGAP